jgi:hypothetical protein
MKIEIKLSHETEFGYPQLRCAIDENAPFYNGNSQPVIFADINMAPGYHEMVITHYNKQVDDQIIDSSGNIIKDKHVEILSISIDDILFRINELQEGHFYPVYNLDYVRDCEQQGVVLPYSISPNLYLGHNGTWKLNFYTPFIEYIIDKRQNLGVKLENTIFQSDTALLTQAKQWFDQAPDIVWKP